MFTEGLLYSSHVSKHLHRLPYVIITVALWRDCCCLFVVWWNRGAEIGGDLLQTRHVLWVSQMCKSECRPATCRLFHLSEKPSLLGRRGTHEWGCLWETLATPNTLQLTYDMELLCSGRPQGDSNIRMLTEVGEPGLHGSVFWEPQTGHSEVFGLQSLAASCDCEIYFVSVGLLCKILAPPCGGLAFSGDITFCFCIVSTRPEFSFCVKIQALLGW